jgi:hypothetical protein
MTYLMRQLLLLITKSGEALGKQSDSIGTIQKDNNKHQQVQQKWLEKFFPLYEKSERDKAISDQRHYSIQNSIRRATWIAAIAAVIAAGGGIFYARTAYRQWEISQRQLEAVERPWLKVTFAPGPVTFKDGGMQFGVYPHLSNVGHSVATGAIVPIKIFLASNGNDVFKEPLKRQKELCDPLAIQPISKERDEKRIAVFQDTTDSSLFLGEGFSKAEIDSAPTANTNFKIKHLVPIIVGCVDYQYGTSTRHHQTRFIYEVFRADPRPNTSIEVGQDLPADSVVLTPYPFGGFSAN